MTRNRRTGLGVLVALIVLAVDQASKYWVRDVIQLPDIRQIVLSPVLNLTWECNHGITFGLLNGSAEVSYLGLAAVALAIVAVLGFWLRRAETALVAAAIGAIGGGAVGNVTDRLRFGCVNDFIHAHIGEWSWYVFNAADAAIVCGVAALVLEGLLPRRARPAALPGGEPGGKQMPHVNTH